MNKKTILTFMMIAATTAASAQKITVKEAEIDCRKVQYFKPVTATFNLKNKGSRRLKINDVRVSCGCIKADYPKEEIASGDEFTISLTYDARQMGHFFKEAAIYSNGSKEPLYLSMKGIVMEDVPDYTGDFPFVIGNLRLDKRDLEFDNVNKGDQPVIDIHIINDGTTVLEPNLMHLPPYLTTTSSKQYLRPGNQGKISVTLHTEKLRDYGVTETSVYLANKPGDKVSIDNEITASAVLLPQFAQMTETQRLNAPQLTLSANEIKVDLADKDKATERIELTNSGKSPLQISSLHMYSKALKLTLGKRTLKPGEKTTMKVTVEREAYKNARTRPRILMITNDPKNPKIEINITTL